MMWFSFWVGCASGILLGMVIGAIFSGSES